MASSRWPLLEEFFAPVLDEAERVLQQQRALREGSLSDSAEGVVRRGGDHHFAKADGHMTRVGPDFSGFDEDDRTYHIVLAALRLLMTSLCVLTRARKENNVKS